ncbi:MAG TPA: family 1 glycosylhydrolase [Actinomycetota bacterium]|nr:family 1 glycosylhydrolase [Actinomycetota bacterium]
MNLGSRAPRFPDRFLWGAATSAHQVEGNQDNDWTQWEKTGACVEVSGDACDHYNRYEEDIALLAGLGLNSFRFSIEWSRIEPRPNDFSEEAIAHYSDVLTACHEHDLVTAVSFHHFTNPRWVADGGGWENPRVAELFARFCEHTARSLGSDIDLVVTINEPNMPPLLGYADAVFPPGKRDPEARMAATHNFIAAHEAARDVIHEHTDAPVGIAVAMADWHLVEGGDAELGQIRSLREDVFLASARSDDYIGVNTYTRHRVGPDGFMDVEDGVELTAMGYEFYPSAVGATVRRAAELTERPVIVTEVGIGTNDDTRREAFIEAAIHEIDQCVSDGIDMRGFYYWSALDNFEWHHGYGPKFGLVAVDRDTQKRTVKRSGRFLGDIASARRA